MKKTTLIRKLSELGSLLTLLGVESWPGEGTDLLTFCYTSSSDRLVIMRDLWVTYYKVKYDLDMNGNPFNHRRESGLAQPYYCQLSLDRLWEEAKKLAIAKARADTLPLDPGSHGCAVTMYGLRRAIQEQMVRQVDT